MQFSIRVIFSLLSIVVMWCYMLIFSRGVYTLIWLLEKKMMILHCVSAYLYSGFFDLKHSLLR